MSSTAMNIAMTMATQVEHSKWRLGSVLVRGGSVLSRGSNRSRNDPRYIEDEKYFESTVHAEINCLKQAKNPEGATLYVARLTPGNNIALAKPCNRCRAKLISAGVKKIVYTNYDGDWETEKI